MALNRSFVLAVVVSFIVIGHIETSGEVLASPAPAENPIGSTGDNKIAIDKLLGKWYTIAVIFPYTYHVRFSCVQTIISGRHDNASFDVFALNNIRNNQTVDYSFGQIDNDKMFWRYPSHNNEILSQYVTFYNNDQEMILQEVGKNALTLYSRSVRASTETMKIFQNYIHGDMSLAYVYHNDCP